MLVFSTFLNTEGNVCHTLFYILLFLFNDILWDI